MNRVRRAIHWIRMGIQANDEIRVMTTDIDQEERDFIDAAMTMPPGAWGIADYYRIQRLRKLANKQAAAKAALETQQREGK